MKFTVDKEIFSKAMHQLSGVILQKSTISILFNALLEAYDNKLKITTTDLEITLIKEIPADIIEEGSIALPAKKLYDISKNIPVDEIEFTQVDTKNVQIKGGNLTYKLNGQLKDEFPQTPNYDIEKNIEIPQGEMKKMIAKTIFSVSTDETRFTLMGIYLCSEGGYLTFVSTDGHRLSFAQSNEKLKIDLEKSMIVPYKTFSNLKDLLEDSEDKVVQINLTTKDNQILFTLENSTLISRLITGEYPNYKSVIPESFDLDIIINTSSLFDATQRVALMADSKRNSIKYEFQDDELIVNTITPEVGEGKEVLSLEYKGDELNLLFNSRYITDILKNIETETVLLKVINSTSPIVFMPNPDEGKYKFVLMPMRL
ncbi:DNA polymerase III subunit beta [Candidatus Dependentiae bacterium]|nr:DNA polymerase III subunit beta [Candidatus Dependentiae bacterium]